MTLNAGDDWNFVFGIARASDGVGVYSFARMDPEFPDHPLLSAENSILMLKRCCKVICHELGHLFGLKHCIYFWCLLNGA